MAKPPMKKAGPETLGRDARRLVLALAQDGAMPGRTDLREGFLAVAAPRNGITSIISNAPIAAGEELVRRDLARWTMPGEGRRLAILPEGVAFARRLAARPTEDPFQAQHLDLVVKSVAPGESPVAVDEGESPLSWLARRKNRTGAAFLASPQVEAGERFGRDIVVAQLLPRVTSDWSGGGGGGVRGPERMNIGDLAIAARQRLDRAAAAVGPEMSGLLIDICGFQKRLELVERERSWPPRSAKVVLRIALDRLAAHYGLAAHARGPDRASGVRAWGDDGYRPVIDGPA